MADARSSCRRAFRAVALAAAALAGCAGQPPPERELRVALSEDLPSFDPQAWNTVGAYQVLSSVYEPLVRLDRSLRPVPALAVSWENPDVLTWVFRLRAGVRFHDGSPFSSEDVVASLRRLLADESLGMRSFVSGVAEVEARGEDTVIVRTVRPNTQLASRLHFVLIVPRGSTSASLARRANGTGPYAVAGWSPPSLRLVRHAEYWGEPPGLARVRIDMGMVSDAAAQSVAEGLYDVVEAARRTEGAARRSGHYQMLEQENIFLRHLAFDVERERTPFCPGISNPFRRPEVREAVSLALDRRQLAATAGPGARPADQLVPQSVFGHDSRLLPIEPDPARARALLARAGLARGFDVVLHRGGFAAAAELVKAQLAEVGIRVRVEAMPPVGFFEALEHRELSFWILASGSATGDGLELLEESFHSPGPGGLGVHNYGGYREPEMDREILVAGTLFDLRRRQETVKRLLGKALADRPWIPLYYDRGALAIARGLRYEPRADGYLWVAGVRPDRESSR